MTSRIGSCLSCVSCESCGNPAYCLDDTAAHPCPHDRALCSDCNLEVCLDCRLEAEADMYHSGQYDPRADPFYTGPDKSDQTLADVIAEQRAHVERYTAETGYDPTTTTTRSAS